MADRAAELLADKEGAALKKLQAAAGLMERSQAERLDWMYEQRASSIQPTDEELMNRPVADQKDKDVEDVKKLKENVAGSIFLRSATKTTEDMLRKLREDPLFQIRRQEQAAKESMAANPLIMARIKKKMEKEAKKQAKKVKKAMKKEKKAMKKAKKKAKKGVKSSDSSDSSDSDGAPVMAAAVVEEDLRRPREEPSEAPPRKAEPPRRERSPRRSEKYDEMKELGPSSIVVNKREEYTAQLAARKEAALASRGAPRRMTEEEKQKRFEQMKADAAAHERYKDKRIASAEVREKQIEEMEEKMRTSGDQKYFRDMRKQVYMEEGNSVADRLKNQRHRRQKNLNDPLEKDN